MVGNDQFDLGGLHFNNDKHNLHPSPQCILSFSFPHEHLPRLLTPTVFTFSLFHFSSPPHPQSDTPPFTKPHSSLPSDSSIPSPKYSWGFSWVFDQLQNPQTDSLLLLWFPTSFASCLWYCSLFFHACLPVIFCVFLI